MLKFFQIGLGVFTFSVLVNLLLKKYEPRFVPCNNLFFLRLCFFPINVSSKLAWSTVFVAGLVLLISTDLLISWRTRCVGL